MSATCKLISDESFFWDGSKAGRMMHVKSCFCTLKLNFFHFTFFEVLAADSNFDTRCFSGVNWISLCLPQSKFCTYLRKSSSLGMKLPLSPLSIVQYKTVQFAKLLLSNFERWWGLLSVLIAISKARKESLTSSAIFLYCTTAPLSSSTPKLVSGSLLHYSNYRSHSEFARHFSFFMVERPTSTFEVILCKHSYCIPAKAKGTFKIFVSFQNRMRAAFSIQVFVKACEAVMGVAGLD